MKTILHNTTERVNNSLHTDLFFQPKLSINQPNDVYEQQADAVADRVMRMPASLTFSKREENQSKTFFQPSATTVQRQEHHTESQTHPQDNQATILNWLDQHQFAPPAEQAATGERQVILNGGLMSISDATDLAMNDLHLPHEVINSVIVSEAARVMPISARGAAYVGGGNQVPGLPLDPQTPEQHLLITQADELGRIDDWLNEHHFSKLHDPNPARAMIDGTDHTIEEIADLAIPVLGASPHVDRSQVITHLRRRYLSAPSAPGDQWSLQVATGGVLHHYVTPASSTDPLQEWVIRATAAYTRQFHGANQSGLELQGLIQAQYSVTTGQWSVLGGGQATYAIALPYNFTASAFVQLLGGAAFASPVQGQIQPAIGAQIVWQPADWLNLGLQGSGSYTGSIGGTSSLDAGGVFMITVTH